MFRGGNRVPARRVHDDDAAASGGFDINVIDSDAGAPNDAQTTRLLSRLRRSPWSGCARRAR